jgi:hypothetical protein
MAVNAPPDAFAIKACANKILPPTEAWWRGKQFNEG